MIENNIPSIPAACQECEHFMPVIGLDTCKENMTVIAILTECPLGKWNGD